MDTRFITKVVLRNYRSIKACDVSLSPLTYLVGPNGSGKSNFLDSLRFVSDSLNTTLDHALRERGGIGEVRRRSGGHPTHFSIEIHFQDRENRSGAYKFEIVAKKPGGFEVRSEECHINGFFGKDAFYKVENGSIKASSMQTPPAAIADRLYLVNVSGTPEFNSVYESLSQMGFYNLNPDKIRDLQSPDAGDRLSRDGSNIASVIKRLEQFPAIKSRIEEFLSQVVAGVEKVDAKVVGPKETLEFRQQVQGAKDPWRFYAANMSDGTLRALGILVALFQAKTISEKKRIPFVGIEEPEVALHPAAAGVLRDALNDASSDTQILVTSHSPDLLDDEDIPSESILAVRSDKGITHIAPLDRAGKESLKARLYTAGELLRMDQLSPDLDYISKSIDMFDGAEDAN